MNKFRFFICFLGTFLAASVSTAADVPEAFLACADETSDLDRLACYDEAMRAATAGSALETAPVAAAVAVAAAPEKSAEPRAAAEPGPAPGSPPAAVEAVAVEEAPAATVDPAPVDVMAKAEPAADSAPSNDGTTEDARPGNVQTFIVRDVFRQPRGENGVVLENGEVWQEPTASRYFPVEPGDRVTFKKRMFGGYRMVTESGKAFSVSKVR